MTTYDWIVIGNGLAGAALSYELQNVGFAVLLLDQAASPTGATRYSYGGIAYWSGATALMRQLCQEGIAIHRQLGTELGENTHFRDVDLLLTIDPDRDPASVAATYAQVTIPPTLLEPASASEREPLLNAAALSGALCFPHAQVDPEALINSYNQAFLRLGGTRHIAQVTGWVRQGNQIQGVVTADGTFQAGRVAVAAGAMTRLLLRSVGLGVRQYFTHAELIETLPVEMRLQAMVMPAELQRFKLEAEAGAESTRHLWDEPGHEVSPFVLDAGAVQLQDGRLRLGQISRTLTDPAAPIDAGLSEAALRQAIGKLLPSLASVPGVWHRCLVSFSGDGLPLVGAIPQLQGIDLFTAFSNPFAILPPLARRFAQTQTQPTCVDPLLLQLLPDRCTPTPISG